jgi:hypothetical protein
MGFKMMGGKSPKAKTGAGIPLNMKSPLYKNEDPIGSPKKKAKKPIKKGDMRTIEQLDKQYPGIKEVKGKLNTYKYKGTTINPGAYEGNELSDADKIKKAINKQ